MTTTPTTAIVSAIATELTNKYDAFKNVGAKNLANGIVEFLEGRMKAADLVKALDVDVPVRSLARFLPNAVKNATEDAEFNNHNDGDDLMEELGDELENEIEEELSELGRDVVKPKYRERYGSKRNCGDDLATVMKQIPFEELASVAESNGIDFGRWSHLNNGLQRMNLGNTLRGVMRRGGSVVVNGQKFEATTVGFIG